MSDYDIIVKLDPAQPVAGAKQVAGAVAEVENQGKKAKEAMDGVASAAKSLKSIEFKQAAAAGAAAWGILSAKLDIANTAIGQAIDSSVKFGAIGAQLAGPWGAALGAIGGAVVVLTDNITGLRSEVTKLAEESKKLAEDAIAKMGGELGDLTREVLKNADAATKQNAAWMELPRTLSYVFQSFSHVRDVLKDVDKDIKAYDESLRKTGLLMLVKASDQAGRGAQKVSGPTFDASGYGKSLGLGDDFAKRLATIVEQQKALEAADLRTQAALRPDNPDLATDYEAWIKAQDDLNARTLRLAENTRKWNEELVATNVTAQVVSDVLTKAASSFADTLVDAANGADVSWRKWGEDMLVMIEKVIAQALILKAIGASTGGIGGGGTGLLGLLFGGAHASGGSYTAPATGGGPDSIPVMFRMSPRETATFTPHGQAFGGSAGGGGPGAISLTVAPQIHDERAIQSAMAGPGGQRVIYSVVRQALGAVRPLG